MSHLPIHERRISIRRQADRSLGPDRRQHCRRENSRIHHGGEISFEFPDLKKKGKAVALDYSRFGARIELPLDVAPGTKVRLHLKLPGSGRSLNSRGVVIWKSERSSSGNVLCGVAFEKKESKQWRYYNEKLIYFFADQICSVAERLSGHFHAHLAATLAEIKTCYHLTYREYVLRKYCETHPAELHYSYFALLPDSRVFFLKREHRMLGTVSLIPDSPCGLPLETVFPQEIRKLRKTSVRLAEVSLLALDHRAFGKSQFCLSDFQKMAGLFRLFKILFEYACEQNISDLVIGMHPKHKALYKYIGFETMAPARAYAGACGNLALLMRLNLEKAVKRAMKIKVLSKYFLDDNRVASGFPDAFRWTNRLVWEWLHEKKPLWEHLPAEAKIFMSQVYDIQDPIVQAA